MTPGEHDIPTVETKWNFRSKLHSWKHLLNVLYAGVMWKTKKTLLFEAHVEALTRGETVKRVVQCSLFAVIQVQQDPTAMFFHCVKIAIAQTNTAVDW